jgi:DNA-binding LytR/AlgR family response regulator
MIIKARTETLGLGLYSILPETITHVEQNREYFAIHYIGGSEPIKMHGTSKDADKLFPSLVRIQRTYLININQVSSVHSRIGRQVDVCFRNGVKIGFIKSDIHHENFIEKFTNATNE